MSSFKLVKSNLDIYQKALGLILALLSIDFLINYNLFRFSTGLVHTHDYLTYPTLLKSTLPGVLFSFFILILNFTLIYKFFINKITLIEKFILFILTISLVKFYLNYQIGSAAYTYLTSSLFWLIFITEAKSERSYVVLSFIFRLQIASVYLFTALLKNGDDWLSNFNAIEYTLRSNYARPIIKEIIDSVAPLGILKVLTVVILIIEFSIPALILLPFKRSLLDKIAAILILFFHISIYIFTEPLFFFVLVFCLNSLLIWPNSVISEAYQVKVNRVLEEVSKALKRINREIAIISVSILCITIIISTNIIELSGTNLSTLKQIMAGTNLYQTWKMFAPSAPLLRSWVEIIGKKEDGSLVNILDETKKIGNEPRSYNSYYDGNNFLFSYFSNAFHPSNDSTEEYIRIQAAGHALDYFCNSKKEFSELEFLYYRVHTKVFSQHEAEHIEHESLVHIRCKDLKSITTSMLPN